MASFQRVFIRTWDEISPSWAKSVACIERHALEGIASQLAALIELLPPEADAQQFVEQHTIVLHRLSPFRIIPKAKILTKHVTDFAVLSETGELWLIELERPGMPLLRSDGGDSAELTHAIKQVRDWLHEYELHRAAVLDCMGLHIDEVVRVRGVVIAGTERPYPEDHLRRMRWVDRGHVAVFTFNDLARDLDTLIRDFGRL